MKNIILLTPIYESKSRKTIIITKDDTYGLFEIMSRHAWYWNGDSEEPIDKYKPLQDALDNCEFKEFERLYHEFNFCDEIGYNIEVQ